MKRLVLPIIGTALILSACGGAGDTTTTTTPATTTPATTGAPATTTPATTGATPVTTTTAAVSGGLALADSSLGQILVDGTGKTLYLFKPDAQGDSTCYDTCEQNWPPLTGDLGAGDGVDGGSIGATTRTDGTTQVTYNGWPLYYFGGDAAAGDTNGQGLSDVWYVVSAAGEPIE